jgi:hypothetical protein
MEVLSRLSMLVLDVARVQPCRCGADRGAGDLPAIQREHHTAKILTRDSVMKIATEKQKLSWE